MIKNIEESKFVTKRLEKESEKFGKFFSGRFKVQWSLVRDANGEHTTNVNIQGPHFNYNSKTKSHSLNKSILLCISKMNKHLKKKKDKLRGKVNRKNLQTPRHTQVFKLAEIENYHQNEEEEGVVRAA
jgi:ribosome-associated translation inhibitor RaiA